MPHPKTEKNPLQSLSKLITPLFEQEFDPSLEEVLASHQHINLETCPPGIEIYFRTASKSLYRVVISAPNKYLIDGGNVLTKQRKIIACGALITTTLPQIQTRFPPKFHDVMITTLYRNMLAEGFRFRLWTDADGKYEHLTTTIIQSYDIAQPDQDGERRRDTEKEIVTAPFVKCIN